MAFRPLAATAGGARRGSCTCSSAWAAKRLFGRARRGCKPSTRPRRSPRCSAAEADVNRKQHYRGDSQSRCGPSHRPYAFVLIVQIIHSPAFPLLGRDLRLRSGTIFLRELQRLMLPSINHMLVRLKIRCASASGSGAATTPSEAMRPPSSSSTRATARPMCARPSGAAGTPTSKSPAGQEACGAVTPAPVETPRAMGPRNQNSLVISDR